MDFFDRTIEVDEKTELVISQAYVSDVGGVVWDAALVLNAYIGTLECNEKTFIELGAGTGVSGLETRLRFSQYFMVSGIFELSTLHF